MTSEQDLSRQNYLRFMTVLVATPKNRYSEPFKSLRFLLESIQQIDADLNKINVRLFLLNLQCAVTGAQSDFRVMIYKLDYNFAEIES